MISKEAWNTDTLLVLNGDMPLVTQDIIEQLHATHQQKMRPLTLLPHIIVNLLQQVMGELYKMTTI